MLNVGRFFELMVPNIQPHLCYFWPLLFLVFVKDPVRIGLWTFYAVTYNLNV